MGELRFLNRRMTGGADACCLGVANNDRLLLVADLGTDEISAYGIGWDAGCVTPNAAPAIKAEPGDGPRQFVSDRSGKFLYLIVELVAELGNTVRVYAYDSETGAATFLQALLALPNECVASIAACIKLRPNGEFLCASNRGHDSIASYRVQKDGMLTPLSIQKAGGKTPRDFNRTPDGAFLLSEFQDSNEMILYRINLLNGQLAELERTQNNSATAV